MLLPQNTGGRVRLARNMIGLTRKEIEEKFEISSNTLQSWETGKNSLTQKGAKRLNEVFIQLGLLCSEDWLICGKGPAPVLLEDISKLPFGITEDICILREIEAFKAINPNPLVLIVPDSGMEPIYEIGDYVAGNKKTDEDITSIIGENCIVETFQGDTLVRRIMRGSKEFTYNLICLNIYSNQQPIITDVKIRYAAKVVLHRRKENIKN